MGTYKSIIYVRSTDIEPVKELFTGTRTVLIFYVVEWHNNQYVQYSVNVQCPRLSPEFAVPTVRTYVVLGTSYTAYILELILVFGD